ncbi:MAG: hypothetical protein HONBIEJF_01517 [Fimbriimonadaceae bacterium]|nr:hypothetical protein [Fimbriimonadaceae bacterium]
MAKKAFQILTIVRLVTPDREVPDTPDDDAIQAAHIRYLTGLAEAGKILANGPIRRKDDTKWRGMSLYLIGANEARELAHADPAVKAGWFDVVVDEWMIPVRPRTIADREDLEIDVPGLE